MKTTPRVISVLGLVAALTACSSSSTPQGGSGGKGSGGSGGVASSQGGSSAGGSGGAAGTGGSSAMGGTTSKPGSGGSSAAGGTSGSAGGSQAGGSGGHPGTGGISASGGTTSQPGTGGSASGGTTTKPGTGGAPASGGNPGRDGGPGTGGAGGGSAIDGGTSPAGQSAGCGKTSTITSSQYNNGKPISITVGSQQRRYILNIPTKYVNTTAYKFILVQHELNGNDVEMYNQKYYNLLPLSNDAVIFAAANGVNGSNPCSGTGSGDSGCGWPSGNMPVIDAVVKQVTDNFCVDMGHIYATGWSYGASMSYEIGCERPLEQAATNGWGVRAIAIYAAAQMSGSCKPSTANPVAYYASHGTHDSVLNYSGGVTLAQNMATANGCTWATPTSVSSGTHVCTKLAGCKTGYPLEFCSFNGDHTPYPDSGNESSSWGPQEVWTFLSQF